MAAAGLTAAFIVHPVQAQAQGPSAPQAAARTSGGKIGVAALGAPGLSADLRTKLEDAAAAGLRASGAEVVPGAELSRARASAALGACTDSACEQRLAQLTDTRYWLRGNVALDTSTYRIHLELTDARSGAVLSARDDTCDICTEAEATEAVNMAASTLKAAAKPNLSAAPAASGTATAVSTVPPAAAAATGATTEEGGSVPLSGPGAGDAGPDQATSPRPMWLRVLPWVAFAGAAAALTASAYAWSVDGDTETCPPDSEGHACTATTNNNGWTYAYAGAGVALAAAGVVLLLLPDPAPAGTTTAASTAARLRPASVAAPRVLGVGIWGNGIALSGRF